MPSGATCAPRFRTGATNSPQARLAPYSGSTTSLPLQYGNPKCWPAFCSRLSSHGGESSPSQSRPLSVNHSSFVWGWKSMPTVLRPPRATTSWPEPSALMRVITLWRSAAASQTLHGAPIGT